MPQKKAGPAADRVKRILQLLRETYPDASCELDHRNPLELLVATILSAQCTDKRVNQVTPALFAKYRTAADFARAPQEELEEAIRSTGFYRNKARNIQACCRKLVERHGGEVPASMEALTQLDGVGRKTANVILGSAFGLAEGVVVDTHVIRLSNRLGFTTEQDPEKIERTLMALVPREEWTLFSHRLVWHGRRRCAARKPGCEECELASDCPRTGVAVG
jgi:endonuclease-3